jgi:hypothetical protein
MKKSTFLTTLLSPPSEKNDGGNMILWKVDVWSFSPEHAALHLRHVLNHCNYRYNINAHVSITIQSMPWSLFWHSTEICDLYKVSTMDPLAAFRTGGFQLFDSST